jgi:hypothetical protein
MYVLFRFQDEPRGKEILYIYTAKADLEVLRKRYSQFREATPEAHPYSLIEQLEKDQLILIRAVLGSPIHMRSEEETDLYSEVMKSEYLTII